MSTSATMSGPRTRQRRAPQAWTPDAAWTEPAPRLGRRFFAVDSPTLARRLLGQRLVRVLPDGARVSGIIVETEAYIGPDDRASHAWNGRRTARNESMYGPPGTAYVYFTYGMHHCFNVVCGRAGQPIAVLIRALAPVEGVDFMEERRGYPAGGPGALCSGPGKLCQALAIDRHLDGVDLPTDQHLFVERTARPGRYEEEHIAVSPRIGIAFAGAWAAAPLRWYLRGCPHVSRRAV